MSPPLPLSYPDGDDIPLAGTAGGRNLPLLQTSVPVLVVQSPRCRQLCHSRPRTPRSGGCARSHGREIHRRKLPAKWSLASFSHSLVTAFFYLHTPCLAGSSSDSRDHLYNPLAASGTSFGVLFPIVRSFHVVFRNRHCAGTSDLPQAYLCSK